MTQLPGKFVWFEHVSTDPAQARRFYEGLCGWTTQSVPMGEQTYDIITNAGTGIGGYRKAEPGQHACWACYLSVPDVDKAFAAALAAGAKAVTGPMDYGQAGRGAVVTDPTGARLSLWTGARDDPADVGRTPVGGWCWNELHAKDAKAAVAFYTSVFGLAHEAMDMGAAGIYTILKDAGGARRGGILQQESGVQAPSSWLPYIEVADCDAATGKAMQLGAQQTIAPPTEVEHTGRFSIVMDPLGAPIGLIQSAG